MTWQNEFTPLLYDVIDSTNAEAIRIAKRGALGNFLIWGGVQTAGKGKYGRVWHSEPGNLHISLLLNQKYQIYKASQLVYVASIALVNALNEMKQKLFDNSHNKFYIKWPNDIILNHKKCAGILLESQISSTDNNCDFVVIGIGVNTKICPQHSDANFAPTSLFENEVFIDNNELIDKFMSNFMKIYDMWFKNNFEYIQSQWQNNAFMMNEKIKVSTRNNIITGILKGLNEDGLLIITSDEGEDISISTGEVFLPDNL
ncbi:MAG: biotin--[acetyl-CoA-carboxylase] ligase [Alphaproteobacteria bacterium]|nr:biotin--[acetyl-CoA-carboxylase] ligase [Alphaproteobacteria bacterium]OJV12485.1 MAG: biotin--[acetyl-CoA-carboxylase] ligase [Alphaproteobacteria bacterium 33-17]